jgi:hypothetical protein
MFRYLHAKRCCAWNCNPIKYRLQYCKVRPDIFTEGKIKSWHFEIAAISLAGYYQRFEEKCCSYVHICSEDRTQVPTKRR